MYVHTQKIHKDMYVCIHILTAKWRHHNNNYNYDSKYLFCIII